MRVVVLNHLSLDGVLQAPGGADEDVRDGFRHGGWAAAPLGDPEIGATIGSVMSDRFSWLFGEADEPLGLELVGVDPTSNGVVLARYRGRDRA